MWEFFPSLKLKAVGVNSAVRSIRPEGDGCGDEGLLGCVRIANLRRW